MKPQIPIFLEFFHSISFFLLLHQRTITSRFRKWRSPMMKAESAANSVSGRCGGFRLLLMTALRRRFVESVGSNRKMRPEGVGGSPSSLIPQLRSLSKASHASPLSSARALLLLRKSPPEVKEKPGNHFDITLSIHYDGSDESKEELLSHMNAFFQLKQQNKKNGSRAETGQLGELLYSRTIETPGYQKKKVKINNNSNINPSSSHQIREEDFGKFLTFGCKRQINHKDCQNNCMTQKVTPKSEMYKMARFPFFGSSLMTNTRVLKRGSSDRDELFFKDARRVRQKSCLKDLNLTTHAGTSSTPIILDQEQELGSSDRDKQCFDDARRVCQKSCLKDLNLTTHAGTSSTPIILDQEQEPGSSDRDEQCFDDARRVRQKSCLKDLNLTTHADTSSTLTIFDQEQRRQRIDSKGLNNSDCKIRLASDLLASDIFAPPPRSTEMAKKILYEINKL